MCRNSFVHFDEIPQVAVSRGPQQKPEEKIAAIRKIIQEESPDLIVLEA